MAEEQEQRAENPPAEAKKRPLWLVVLAAVVAAAGGAGFAIGTALRPAPAQAQAQAAQPQAPPSGTTDPAGGIPQSEYTYYEFEPITVNLDEPRLARYIRATIILAIRADQSQGVVDLLDKKRPELKNWLTIFLASRTLEEVRGAQGLNRMRREIGDSFNEQLWPNRGPVIGHVLLKDFAVQ